MPTTVEYLGSGVSTGAAITLSPSSQINVGDFIVLMWGERDHTFTGSTIADNSSQAGASNVYAADAVIEVTDAFVGAWSCRVTRNILTSDIITATLSSSGGGQAITLLRLTPIVSATPFDNDASAHRVNAASAFSTGASPATAQADEILIGGYIRATQGANGTNGGTNPDSPWVEQDFQQVSSSDWLVASQIVASVSTYTFSGVSDGTTGQDTCLFVTYKIQVGAIVRYTILNGSDQQLTNVNAAGANINALSYKAGIPLTSTELATLLDGATFGHRDIAVMADLTGDLAAFQKKAIMDPSLYYPSA